MIPSIVLGRHPMNPRQFCRFISPKWMNFKTSIHSHHWLPLIQVERKWGGGGGGVVEWWGTRTISNLIMQILYILDLLWNIQVESTRVRFWAKMEHAEPNSVNSAEYDGVLVNVGLISSVISVWSCWILLNIRRTQESTQKIAATSLPVA